MTKRKWKTAAELMAELSADPSFVARQREQEQARLNKEAEFHRAERPLIDALTRVGVRVQSVWDLVNTTNSYPKAVPVLLEHLQRPYPERVREGIARALAVPDAIKEWETLRRLFEREADATTTGVKWALGCILAAAASDDVIDDVIGLLQDRSHGGNRIALISALARSADPRARRALMEAGADPELSTEVQRVLKLSRRKSAPATRRDEFKTKEVPSGLSEASMNFDSTQVGPFLKRVTELVSHFGTREIAQVTGLLHELEVGEERELRFEVKHAGQTVPLLIGVFMDDVDTPDLYLFTVPQLAVQLEELMRDFCEEQPDGGGG
jgi:hypothetical protein